VAAGIASGLGVGSSLVEVGSLVVEVGRIGVGCRSWRWCVSVDFAAEGREGVKEKGPVEECWFGRGCSEG